MIGGEPMSSAVASSRFIDVVAGGPYHLGNSHRSNNGFGISSNNRGEERYPFAPELRHSYRNLERTIDRSEQIPLYQQLSATSLMPVQTASFCHYNNTSAATEAASSQRSSRGLERLSFDSMNSAIVEADSGSRERSYSWPSQPCPAVETAAALYSSSNACGWPTSRLMSTSSSIGCTDVDSMGCYAERQHHQQTGNMADMSTTVWARKTGWTLPPSASVRRLSGLTRTTTTFPPTAGTDSRPASSVGSVVGASRRNAWGNLSYAELITQAIESSPEKRLTLSQVYDWMVLNVPYFKDKGDSYSSAGWKNSIRHNLSLHSQFARVPNDTAGKSSWWVVNHEARLLKSSRRRATSTDTRTTDKRKGKTKKKVDGTNKSAIEAADTTMEVDSTTSTLPVTDYDSIHHGNHRFSTAAVAISGHVSVGVGVSGSGVTVSRSNLCGRSQFDAFNTTRPRSRSSSSQLSPIDDNNSCGGDGTATSRDSVQQLSPISTSFDWSRGVGTGSRNVNGCSSGVYGFGHVEDRLMVPTAFNCEPIGDGVPYNHTLVGIGAERTLSESLADMLVTGGLGNNGISSSSSVVNGSNGLNRQVRHRHSDSQYGLASCESNSEGLMTSYPLTSKASAAAAAVDWLTGKGQPVAGCYSSAVIPDRFDCQGRYDDDGVSNLEKKKWTNAACQQHSSDILTTCRSVEHVTRSFEESSAYSHAVATMAGSLRRCSDSILTSGRLHPYVSGYHNNDFIKHRDFDASGGPPTPSAKKQKASSLWSDNLFYQSTVSPCRQVADSRGLMVSNDRRLPVDVLVSQGQATSPGYDAECTEAFLQKSYVVCKRPSASAAHENPGAMQGYQSESFRNRMNQIGTHEPQHQQQTAKQTDQFSNNHQMTLPQNINPTVTLSTTTESLAGITCSNEPEVSWSRVNSKKSDVITSYDHVTCRDQQAPSSMKPQSTSICGRVSSVNEYTEKMICGISDGKTDDIKKTASTTVDVNRQLISFEDSINYDYYRSGNVTAK